MRRSSDQSDQVTRTERFDVQMDHADAYQVLTAFYASPSQGEGNSTLATITAFPRSVVIALAHAIEYLSTFGVQHALRETRFFARFAERTCMLLGANTLSNLSVLSSISADLSGTDYLFEGRSTRIRMMVAFGGA
jgi:DNA mismatch repair protein MSH3